MPHHTEHNPASARLWKLTSVALLAAGLMAVLPRSTTAPLRDLVRGVFAPVQSAALENSDGLRGWLQKLVQPQVAERDAQIVQLREQLAASELRNHQAQLAARRMQLTLDDIERQGSSPFASESTAPLITTRVVAARVLGHELLADWKSRRLINRGERDGLTVEHWVLDRPQPAVDAGAEQSVFAGLPVLAGRCVVGRVSEAGRQASSLQLITAPDFRAKAQLMRGTRTGLTRVADGLLEGTGDGMCRLLLVLTTEDVRVGDEVFSPALDPDEATLLFGRVSAVERQPGSLHWSIAVKPQADLEHLRTVQIVTTRANPDRLVGRAP